jgi:hypothetical protein
MARGQRLMPTAAAESAVDPVYASSLCGTLYSAETANWRCSRDGRVLDGWPGNGLKTGRRIAELVETASEVQR